MEGKIEVVHWLVHIIPRPFSPGGQRQLVWTPSNEQTEIPSQEWVPVSHGSITKNVDGWFQNERLKSVHAVFLFTLVTKSMTKTRWKLPSYHQFHYQLDGFTNNFVNIYPRNGNKILLNNTTSALNGKKYDICSLKKSKIKFSKTLFFHSLFVRKNKLKDFTFRSGVIVITQTRLRELLF